MRQITRGDGKVREEFARRFPMTKMRQGLYVGSGGNIFLPRNRHLLVDNGITHLWNVTSNIRWSDSGVMDDRGLGKHAYPPDLDSSLVLLPCVTIDHALNTIGNTKYFGVRADKEKREAKAELRRVMSMIHPESNVLVFCFRGAHRAAEGGLVLTVAGCPMDREDLDMVKLHVRTIAHNMTLLRPIIDFSGKKRKAETNTEKVESVGLQLRELASDAYYLCKSVSACPLAELVRLAERHLQSFHLQGGTQPFNRLRYFNLLYRSRVDHCFSHKVL